MAAILAEELVQQLTAGFDALQEEYQKLHYQHEALRRKLATARDQYNEVVKLYGCGATATPPLSLNSSPGRIRTERDVAELLEVSTDDDSRKAGLVVRTACAAVVSLRGVSLQQRDATSGVKIWSGRSADRDMTSSAMPSISESPLEQDFTVEGKPSQLGCPFASMAKKKLSSHAASVLSRYQDGSTTGAGSPSMTSASRINGLESLQARKSRDRRSSLQDPIKAEICGLSDHDEDSSHSERAIKDHQTQQANAEPGVCPIRFLDQHSPEEVATYFERHKHELPRSHEICVRRYQSNEEQIRQLDAKYGNLVSMIQGLGAKHKEMLQHEPEDGGEDGVDKAEAAKIRLWANSVSAMGKEPAAEDDVAERQPHFERPLRDVRLGESPSRPFGIRVPEKYEDQAASDCSSKPVEIPAQIRTRPEPRKDTAGHCPFGFDRSTDVVEAAAPAPDADSASERPQAKPANVIEAQGRSDGAPRMTFTGPVFFGYSAEDAAKILRDSGLAKT